MTQLSDNPSMDSSDLHVALLAPEIPWNTGNLGRTCVATGCPLHLIRPLGFSLDEKRLKRAGLDYWPHVDLHLWDAWADFEARLGNLGTPWFFSAEGTQSLWEVDFDGPTVLVFGCETSGLPPAIRRRYDDRLLAIPMHPGPVRSLNLSTSAAVAVFEVLRQRHQRGHLRHAGKASG